jgi:glycosyltransferase involved in cell wall biosynthesis
MNVLVVTYWSYPDALIQTYTLPYLRIIKKNLPPNGKIFLVTLEKDISVLTPSKREKIADELLENGLIWLPFPYHRFGMIAILLWAKILIGLIGLIVKNKVQVIHTWCTPAGAAGYVLSVVLNRTLVLDSYEPHAELMVENGTWKKNSVAFRLLFWLEKRQSKRAKFVIGVNEKMQTYAQEKYNVALSNYFVKPACVDLTKFDLSQRKNAGLVNRLELANKIVCVYAGKFGGIYLEKQVFDFFKEAHRHWGDRFVALLLTNHPWEGIQDYCRQSDLDLAIVKVHFVPHAEVPIYMGLADFAINPMKPIPTRLFSAPIKDGEYWAMGLPVVITKGISDDSELIEKYNAGAVLSDLNTDSYRLAIGKIDTLLQEPAASLAARIRLVSYQFRNFTIAEKVYEEIYRRIIMRTVS